MNLTRVSVVLVSLWSASFPAGLSAGVIAVASASWSGGVCPSGPWIFCAGPVIAVGASETTAGTNASASVSIPSPGVGGAGSSAVAGYGYISASAGANSGVYGFVFESLHVSESEASASASFDDLITIYGGVGFGTVEAFGTFSCCRHYDGNGQAHFRLGTTGAYAPWGWQESGFDVTTSFTFGVPFEIGGSVEADARDFVPYDPYEGSADGFGTVSLSSLSVSDANGQRLEGYTYSSASGSRYALKNGIFTPEPGSGSTTALALASVVVILKMRAAGALRRQGVD